MVIIGIMIIPCNAAKPSAAPQSHESGPSSRVAQQTTSGPI